MPRHTAHWPTENFFSVEQWARVSEGEKKRQNCSCTERKKKKAIMPCSKDVCCTASAASLTQGSGASFNFNAAPMMTQCFTAYEALGEPANEVVVTVTPNVPASGTNAVTIGFLVQTPEGPSVIVRTVPTAFTSTTTTPGNQAVFTAENVIRVQVMVSGSGLPGGGAGVRGTVTVFRCVQCRPCDGLSTKPPNCRVNKCFSKEPNEDNNKCCPKAGSDTDDDISPKNNNKQRCAATVINCDKP